MNDTTFQGNGSVKYVPVVVDTKPKPITNGDKIRASSDEELAEWLQRRQRSRRKTADGNRKMADERNTFIVIMNLFYDAKNARRGNES